MQLIITATRINFQSACSSSLMMQLLKRSLNAGLLRAGFLTSPTSCIILREAAVPEEHHLVAVDVLGVEVSQPMRRRRAQFPCATTVRDHA